MSSVTMHPEDVKAHIRKRYGSVAAFALARGLKPNMITDWLRGRTSAPIAKVIAADLGVDEVHLESGQSMFADDNSRIEPAHRQNAGAR